MWRELAVEGMTFGYVGDADRRLRERPAAQADNALGSRPEMAVKAG